MPQSCGDAWLAPPWMYTASGLERPTLDGYGSSFIQTDDEQTTIFIFTSIHLFFTGIQDIRTFCGISVDSRKFIR